MPALKKMWALLKKTYAGWVEVKAPRLGAALAFYSVFSIAPLLIIVIAIASLVFGAQAAHGYLAAEIANTVGQPAAQVVEDLIRHAATQGDTLGATLIGIAALVVGASGVFLELQDALNAIWGVEERPGQGIWGLVRERLLSFSIVLGVGFLLLVSLLVSTALTALSNFLTPTALPGGAVLWQVFNFIIALALITVLFAMIFKFLPDVQIPWRAVWVGAAGAAVLFSVGKFALGLYLGRTSAATAYGAAGSLVVLLIWVYYSAQLVLMGAQFTRIYAQHHGLVIVPKKHATLVSETRKEEAADSRPEVSGVLSRKNISGPRVVPKSSVHQD